MNYVKHIQRMQKLVEENKSNYEISGKYDWLEGYLPDIEDPFFKNAQAYIDDGMLNEFKEWLKNARKGEINDVFFLLKITDRNQDVFDRMVDSIVEAGGNMYFTQGILDHILRYSDTNLDIEPQIKYFIEIKNEKSKYIDIDPDLYYQKIGKKLF